MNSDSTRDEILIYIQTHHSAKAADIAESMNLTGAAVRYHLARLRKANLIEVEPLGASAEGRGRPAQIYRPSAHAVPHNLIRLANALLANHFERTDDNAEDVWLALAGRLVPSPTAHASLNRRLPYAIEALNQMNHAARWEAGPRGPRILFFNCPYAALLPAYPGLCRMDSLILENLLGKPISQTTWIGLENTRNLACIFETTK